VKLSGDPQPPPDIPAPVKTRYHQLADDLDAALKALMDEMPKLQPHEQR
jgi:hypothetical protein